MERAVAGEAGHDELREQGAEVRPSSVTSSARETRDDARRCRLHDEIVAFYQYISPTPEEAHVRAMVIKLVSDAVQRRFPQGAVDTFGSVAQNLYLPDGCVRSLLFAGEGVCVCARKGS